jgi:hypothetical protein
MKRIRLEYGDHNESFASCLPRVGSITGRFTSTTGMDDWFLVQLDDPVSYQASVVEMVQPRRFDTNEVLIRSRWINKKVGEPEPTPVFLLLVDPSQLPLVSPIRIEDFHHVAWAICHALPDAA